MNFMLYSFILSLTCCEEEFSSLIILCASSIGQKLKLYHKSKTIKFFAIDIYAGSVAIDHF